MPVIVLLWGQILIKMKKTKTIPLYVESKKGDDRTDVPQEQLQGKVEEQLNAGKNVTLEKKDGETELVTKQDIPSISE